MTAASLATMKEFYHDRLGMDVLEERPGELTLRAGETSLTFVQAPADMGEPFYHFAFNIPHNKLMLARDWQKERCPLIPAWANRRDPNYPDDVIHFPSWNAHSLFFWDPAQNIVEFIARHTLKNDAAGPFTSRDILCASEIAFAVPSQRAAATRVKSELGLEPYPSGASHWWAMGDEHGLLLCTELGRHWGTHTSTPKTFQVFPTTARIRGDRDRVFRFPGQPYEVNVEPAS